MIEALIAAEIAAAAPEDLKPCPNPHRIEAPGPKPKSKITQVVAKPHKPRPKIKVLEPITDCGEKLQPIASGVVPVMDFGQYTPIATPELGTFFASAFPPLEVVPLEDDEPLSPGAATLFPPYVGGGSYVAVYTPAIPEPSPLWLLTLGLFMIRRHV